MTDASRKLFSSYRNRRSTFTWIHCSWLLDLYYLFGHGFVPLNQPFQTNCLSGLLDYSNFSNSANICETRPKKKKEKKRDSK